MKTKRFLAALLAVLLLLALVPCAPVYAVDNSWSEAYERFVLNREYLSCGLEFYADEYIEPRFSLYDLDRDGAPELLIFNGGPSLATGADYTFVCENGSIRYVGNVGFRGSAPYYYENDTYPGLFCTDGNMGEYRTVYYELRYGSIVAETVATQDEIANWSGNAVQVTADSKLFALSRSGADAIHSLSFRTYGEIAALGWESFVNEAYGAVHPQAVTARNSVTAAYGADISWSDVYAAFVLGREHLSYEIKLDFAAEGGNPPTFSLYDLGNDGTPELLITNGYAPGDSKAKTYIFTAYNRDTVLKGSIGSGPYFYTGAEYRGLFCNDWEGTSHMTVYYDLYDGVLLSQAVRTFAMQPDQTQLSTQMTFDNELYAWAKDGVPTSLPFYSYDQIMAMGWDGFVQAVLWDSGALIFGTEVTMNADQQYEANIFLSNFSEQHSFEGNPDFNVESARFSILDQLVRFAYLYCKLNRHAAIGIAWEGESAYYTLSLSEANNVFSRFFGFTITEEDAALFGPYVRGYYRAFYDKGTFYFTASDGEAYNRFTVVRRVEDLGDGSFRLLFDIYKLDINEYHKSDAVDSSYYAMSDTEALANGSLTWANSGVAIVRPYSYNGRATYQLVRYTVDHTNSVPAPRKDSAERTVEYKGYSAVFGPESLSYSSRAGLDDYNLALLCALLCEASYSIDGEDLRELYDQMFGDGNWYDAFDYSDQTYCSGIALGTMTIGGVETNVLFITIRGTQYDFFNAPTVGEVLSDILDGTSNYRDYQVFATIALFTNLVSRHVNDLLAKNPAVDGKPTKVVISGHSLGGAAANLLAAQLTMQAPEDPEWQAMTSQENICCYTFGAIDCIDFYSGVSGVAKAKFPISDGFENIHNIYNRYDNFGPNWVHLVNSKKFSSYGKFGHIDIFYKNYDGFTANHAMSSYIKAVAEGTVSEQSKPYSRLWVRCPVDVEVYQGQTLVGSVHGGEVTILAGEIDIVVIEDEKIIVCPTDRAYSFRLTATDDGTMDYTVETITDGMASIRLFENVTLVKGKTMFSELAANGSADEVRLLVVDEQGTPVGEVKEDGTEVGVGRAGANTAAVHEAPSETSSQRLGQPEVLMVLGVLLLAVIVFSAVSGKKKSGGRLRKDR